MICIARCAAKLDIVKLDSVTSNQDFSSAIRTVRERKGLTDTRLFPLTWQVLKYIKVVLGNLLRLGSCPDLAPNAVVFFSITSNQTAALQPVIVNTGCPKTSIDHPDWVKIRAWGLLVSVLFFPFGLVRAYQSSGYQRVACNNYLSEYLSFYGIYVVSRVWFAAKKPAVLVLSNDHGGVFRTLNIAAQAEGIPTAYVQHACVASHFPPLRFNYSFLDGMDAALKYSPSQEDGNVFLTGIAKYNGDGKTRTIDSKRIGICFNLLDSESFVERTLLYLQKHFASQQVICRLHPATPAEIAKRIATLAKQNGILLSDPKLESSFEFSKRIGILVCGASSIILEAALVGVPSIAFFSNEASDVYEFVKNGLCESAKSLEELRTAIEEQAVQTTTELEGKVRFYCAGYGDPDRPPAARIIAGLLESIAAGGINYDDWKRHGEFSGSVWERCAS